MGLKNVGKLAKALAIRSSKLSKELSAQFFIRALPRRLWLYKSTGLTSAQRFPGRLASRRGLSLDAMTTAA